MKNKKFWIIGGIILLVIIGGILAFYFFNNDKEVEKNDNQFMLDSEYYKDGNYIQIDNKKVEDLVNNKKTFLLFTYNNYCNFPIPCDSVFKKVMDKYKIDVLKIPFEEFKDTVFYEKVKIAPSLIIVKEGEIVDYLNADDDEDTDRYQKDDAFKKWLSQYIVLKK